jgi:galactokinase
MRGEFAARFGRPAAVVARAPGRVNLIGEHTDYNDGFVLPLAIEPSTWAAAGPRDDDQLHVVSTNLNDEQQWPIAGWDADRYPSWTSYVAGVALLLRQRGAVLRGADLLIRSDVAPGSGLSSSAALEVATALALGTLAGDVLQGPALADLCRRAEHEYAHVPCGLMDQFVSVLAQAGCAFLLDCRARTGEHIPLQLGDHVVLVVNSGVRHALGSSEYPLRQQQCRQALAYFRTRDPQVRALRDVSSETARAHRDRLDPVVAARALHVTTENERTLAAARALKSGHLAELGPLLYASHASLRDDYQVSCRELDLLVEIVRAVPGVLGARMTGGGFGGCIVALVRRERVVEVERAVRAHYDGAGFGPAHLIVTRAGPGATIEG